MRIAVLAGGRSSEHDVSIEPASAVRAGLAEAGHDVVDVLLERDGSWSCDGEPVSLAMGYANVIWQGDANRLALRSLGVAAPSGIPLNVTGPIVRVRELAERIGRFAGVAPVFTGEEQPDALVANVDELHRTMPYTPLPLDTLCAWAVEWIRGGGRLLGKPTKFEALDGKY